MSGSVKPFAPGSDDAVKSGCLCPVMNNKRGRGAYIKEDGTSVFWYNKKCPMHGQAEPVPLETILIEDNKGDPKNG